jgi:hypothetical protein
VLRLAPAPGRGTLTESAPAARVVPGFARFARLLPRTSDERIPRLRRTFPSRLSRVARAWPFQSEWLDGRR